MQTNTIKILFYIFILGLGACHPSVSVNKELKLVNSIIEEHPDTAMYVLEKIISPQELRAEEYAIYCLLKTQAADMNNILHTSGEDIHVAVEYFKEHPDLIIKFKSYFYLARVQEDMGQFESAERNYQLSLNIAGEIEDYKYAAIAYERLSSLYMKQERYPEALDMQKKSYHNSLLSLTTEEESSWYITTVSLLIIGFLVVFIVRYNLRIRSREKQAGYQERQLNAAKNTIIKQKAELVVLQKELSSMKRVFYESSDIVKKLRQLNDKMISPKQQPSLTESEWSSFLNVLEETYGFISKLKQLYPKLTDIDIRICALLKEGIANSHISSLLNMSPDTLTKRMQRIKSEKMYQAGHTSSLRVILETL